MIHDELIGRVSNVLAIASLSDNQTTATLLARANGASLSRRDLAKAARARGFFHGLRKNAGGDRAAARARDLRLTHRRR